jgi:hypothetical protein
MLITSSLKAHVDGVVRRISDLSPIIIPIRELDLLCHESNSLVGIAFWDKFRAFK